MITIYKYTVHPSEESVAMPRDAEILTTAFQGQELCIWAKIDTETTEHEERKFKVFGTGHNIPQDMGIMYDFIGTAFMDNGLVFHIFEIE